VRLKVRTNSGVKVPVGQKHWLSVAEGNCVVERRGGGQPEANNQSIIKKMMNSIRPDALASMRRRWRSPRRKPTREGSAATSRPDLRRDSERRGQECIGWVEIEWLEVGAT
jgi:hypothetical protein